MVGTLTRAPPATEAFGELEPGEPVVEASVHVRRGHVDQAFGAAHTRHLDDDAHRERGGLAAFALKEGPVALGELDGHRWPYDAFAARSKIGSARSTISSLPVIEIRKRPGISTTAPGRT